MNEIKKNINTPYYIQLMDIINDDIINNRLNNGKLLSENEYSQKYELSISTVRRTLNEIKNEGKIHVQKGIGYFVNKPKIDFDLSKYVSMGRELKERGIKQEINVIKKEIISSDEDLIKEFEIESMPGKLVSIERVRNIYEEPVVYENRYFTYDLFKSLLDIEMNHSFILFDFITEKLKINLVRSSEHVEPINLNREQAAVLNTIEGLASFLLRKVSFDKNNRPIILSKVIIRGDKCRLHSEK